MELADLTQDERTALVAILKQIVMAERHMTEDESDTVAAVAEGLGDDSYQKACDEAELRFADGDALKVFLRTVSRQEARELIFETVLEAAMPGAIEGYESELLAWLGKEWNVEVTFPDQAPDSPSSPDSRDSRDSEDR